MPNGKIHKVVGTAVGCGAAYFRASEQSPRSRTIETLGGMLAGYAGGAAPDILNPAFSPHHRSWAHAILPAGVTGTYVVQKVDGWQGELRDRADMHAAASFSAASREERACHAMMEVFCLLAAGAVVGFAAGYLSHLAMDATTPMGLPLVK